uniref:Uncharacterized protein n=1 Tax=Streptomyces avermitilis TaxID=33903 RepID=A0A499VLC5_STRAX|nr:hypothetical protein SAVMC3_78130 [Streptomyces avermitilis]
MRADVLRELDVVADHEADAEAVQLRLHHRLVARREVVALEAAEEVGLAVVGEPGAVGRDQLGGVEDLLARALG